MLQTPDGGTTLELSSFVRPDHLPGSPAAPANELGLRNVAFEVDDLQAAVDHVAEDGYGLVGGIGEYEGAWRMAYVRGRRGSSSRWPSGSAEPRNPDRGTGDVDARSIHTGRPRANCRVTDPADDANVGAHADMSPRFRRERALDPDFTSRVLPPRLGAGIQMSFYRVAGGREPG
jgi:hypothetical protein